MEEPKTYITCGNCPRKIELTKISNREIKWDNKIKGDKLIKNIICPDCGHSNPYGFETIHEDD